MHFQVIKSMYLWDSINWHGCTHWTEQISLAISLCRGVSAAM